MAISWAELHGETDIEKDHECYGCGKMQVNGECRNPACPKCERNCCPYCGGELVNAFWDMDMELPWCEACGVFVPEEV